LAAGKLSRAALTLSCVMIRRSALTLITRRVCRRFLRRLPSLVQRPSGGGTRSDRRRLSRGVSPPPCVRAKSPVGFHRGPVLWRRRWMREIMWVWRLCPIRLRLRVVMRTGCGWLYLERGVREPPSRAHTPGRWRPRGGRRRRCAGLWQRPSRLLPRRGERPQPRLWRIRLRGRRRPSA
jgi:hypothetical protein